MSRFDAHRYSVIVVYNEIIINAFEIPSRNFHSAQKYGHAIAYSLYPDIEYQINVIQVHKKD